MNCPTVKTTRNPDGAGFILQAEQRLPRRLSEVFPFFADAANLQRITPSFLSFRIVTPRPIEMRVGTLIDYKLRIRGLPVRWQSEITAWDPPFRFVDEQRRGPYRMWVHEHRFEERGGETLITDHIRYDVYGGSLIERLFVRRDVRAIFDYRRRVLDELFGPPADGPVDPLRVGASL